MKRFKNLNFGMSVVEIMVVAALTSLILLIGSIMMSRTTRTFKKGTDMLNTQVLMDGIVERLRTDIRCLIRIIDCTDSVFEFVISTEMGEQNVKYSWDKDRKTLFRNDSNSTNFDFHGTGQVKAFLFQPIPNKNEFQYLNVAMQLTSDEKTGSEKMESRLSIICQFSSRCLESINPFGR
ncbi:MAG: hypothetical protein HQM08_04225 [Candidatus Riflebacteria bacterium]|nr:hypothetical protein [Candidatus Riflebacteria bacterium]